MEHWVVLRELALVHRDGGHQVWLKAGTVGRVEQIGVDWVDTLVNIDGQLYWISKFKLREVGLLDLLAADLTSQAPEADYPSPPSRGQRGR